MNFRSPMFRKLLISALLLIAVALVIVNFYLTRFTSSREIQSTEQRMQAEAQILQSEAQATPAPHFQDWARQAAQRSGTRVTLIDPQGVVLADSSQDPRQMENHAGRPEIQGAHREGVGQAVRYSSTINQDYCYVALRLTYHGQDGYILRLATSLDQVNASLGALRARIWWAGLWAGLLALIITGLFSRSYTQRVNRLRAYADGLVNGKSPPVLLSGPDDELGALGRSLVSAAAQLQDLVSRLKVEAEQRKAILASMVEGVLAVDNNLRITFANASFARAVGVPEPIPAKLPLVELIRDPELREILARVLTEGELVKRRVQLPVMADRIFEVQAAPLTSEAGHGAIAILHDITDLERLERIRKDFVANVSHELRTPLTAIRGYAETLLEGAIEDKENNRRFLEIIKAHSIRLNNIASDLLTLSAMESGKVRPGPEPISARLAVESALRTVEAEARLRGVGLVCGKVEDAQIVGDRFQIEQALVNLLDNAVKFNRPGGEVSVAITRPGNGRLNISIADNGIGIPHDDLPRIFERFYRVDKARSREVGGTGLGLSIVKHIVERLNGTVTVESHLGKGSTFTMVFPEAS